ncbi:MAG TPA: LysR family transcriptional regulator [Chloroflexota bacterium]|nr:LysR family transcriptional regulator [Chloroflexota bacterium]
MELRDLEVFVALGEELHFTRAAERLHIAQPRVSQLLRRLERELDVTLVLRTRRRVELTEAGRVLLEQARRTIAQARTAAALAQSAHRGHTGRLRIGFVEASVHSVLPPAVRSFREVYPGVEIVLTELVSTEQPAALEQGDIDVGILRRVPMRPELIYEELRKDRLVVYMARDHPLAQLTHIEVERLREEPFVYTPRAISPDLFDQVLGMFLRRGFSPRIVQEATQLRTVLALVAAGIGVTVAVESLRPVAGRHVVTRALDDPAAWVSVGLAWNRDDRNPAVPTFLQAVRSHGWR